MTCRSSEEIRLGGEFVVTAQPVGVAKGRRALILDGTGDAQSDDVASMPLAASLMTEGLS
jgi:hypothetical protein